MTNGKFSLVCQEGTVDAFIEPAIQIIDLAAIQGVSSLYPSTLDVALNDVTLSTLGGEALTVKEYSTGNGGGSIWDTIVGTGTADGVFIVAHSSLNLSLVYRERENTIFADEVGIIPGSGQTAKLTTFSEYIHDNGLKGVMRAGQYDVNDRLLAKVTNGKFSLVCQEGQVVFNYTGVEVGNIFQSTDCDRVLLKNITFENNDLVNTPVDLRKSSAFGGTADLFNVNSNNAKETATGGSAVGLQLSGTFAAVQIISCSVNGVTYTTPGRNATGIVLSAFTGRLDMTLCDVRNITTPEDADADGLKVFGVDAGTPTTFLSATAEIHNNVFSDCQGRFIKMQITNFETHGNRFSLSTGFSTITEWRGIDAQFGGGNNHNNNFTFGSGITWGANANIITIANNKNDGTTQVGRFQHNNVTLNTAGLSVIANLACQYGDNEFIINDNLVTGETVDKGFSLRVNGSLIDTDSISIEYYNNEVEDYSGQNLFTVFDDIDYGDKLYLTIKNNRVKNKASVSRLTGVTPPFTINGNFAISNNKNTTDRVDWTFDMNDIEGENMFWLGSQTVLNKGTGITTFAHVQMDGLVQRNFNTAGTIETRRTSLDGITWNAWVTV